MPVYQVVTSGLELDAQQRDRLAKGITGIHHDETQAAEPFIRVVFMPLPLGVVYTAGEVTPAVMIQGGIRYGRGEQVRHTIMHRIHDLAEEVTNVPVDQILVVAQDVPCGWAMEAGIVLPEPTPEAERAWLGQLDALFPGRYAAFT